MKSGNDSNLVHAHIFYVLKLYLMKYISITDDHFKGTIACVFDKKQWHASTFHISSVLKIRDSWYKKCEYVYCYRKKLGC